MARNENLPPKADQPTGKGGERDAQSPGGIHSDTGNRSTAETQTAGKPSSPAPGTQDEKSLQRTGTENPADETLDDQTQRYREAQRKDNPPAL